MKKYFNIKFIIALAILMLSGSFIILDNVSADGDIISSMFVTPMSQELLLIPGETYEGVISVSNAASAQEDLKYSVNIGSYGLVRGESDSDDYGGGLDVQTKTLHNELMDWITIDKDHGSVKPNETDKIGFVIDVPEDAPAGAQYATILVVKDEGSNTESESEGITMQSVYQLASAIIANVAGDTIEKASVIDNSIPSFLTAGPLETTSMVRNDGNVYTNAEYTLQVLPLFSNEEICTNEEKPETSLVLPDTERYHTQSCDLPSIGLFRVKQTVKIFGESSVSEKTVIVCPIWLLFLIIFVFVALVIWIIARVRSRNRNKRED